MKELIVANIFIIFLDVTLLCLEYLALWGIWCSFKGMAYSIKVKIEFSILNQLKNSLQGTTSGNSNSAGHYNRSGRHGHGNGGQAGTHNHSNIEMEGHASSNAKRPHHSNRNTVNYSSAYSSQVDRSHTNKANDQIVKTTEFTVTSGNSPIPWDSHEPKSPPAAITRKGSRSGSSAEVPFATHAA
jgi:hypothetical protein